MEKEIKANETDRTQPLNVPAFKQREKSGGFILPKSLKLHKFCCVISILKPHQIDFQVILRIDYVIRI